MNTNTALIPVTEGTIQGRAQQICNARDLHDFLEVRRDFTNWIKQRIAKYGFVEGDDYVCFDDLSSPDLASAKSRQQAMKEYHLTLDMAKQLSMVENNERGRQARLYFIECERLVLEDLRRKADSPPVVEQLDVDDGYPLLGIIIPKHTRVCLVFSDGGIREIWQPLKAIVVGTPSAVMKVAMGENSARMKEDGEEGGWRSCLPDLFIFAVRPADSVLLITNSNDPIITGFHPSFIVIGQNMYVNEYITENKLTRTFPIRWN